MSRPSAGMLAQLRTLDRRITELTEEANRAGRAERDIAADRDAWKRRALAAEAELLSNGGRS